jgi:hypothetical protein
MGFSDSKGASKLHDELTSVLRLPKRVGSSSIPDMGLPARCPLTNRAMSSKILPPYVIRSQSRGRTYYYFRRKPFPIVRLPGEPGSVLFTDTYTAALRATNLEGLAALRKHMRERRSRRPDSPFAEALWLWANRKPITVEQATMVANLFGVSVDEITRDREIVSE